MSRKGDRKATGGDGSGAPDVGAVRGEGAVRGDKLADRKSTRLNSSHT